MKYLVEQTLKSARDSEDAFELVQERIKRLYEGKVKKSSSFITLSDLKIVLKQEKNKSSEEVDLWWSNASVADRLKYKKIVLNWLKDKDNINPAIK